MSNWEVVKQMDGLHIREEGRQLSIAVVLNKLPDDSKHADLIAASPDLLSIVRFAQRITSVDLTNPAELVLLNAHLGALSALCKVALAKVEGRNE